MPETCDRRDVVTPHMCRVKMSLEMENGIKLSQFGSLPVLG